MTTLKNFFNEISNNSRVFTAEDIGDMTPDEFSQNESAIDYQMSTLGIPFNQDLSGNDDVVYVHAYTRSDGTEVKAHYRSKAGHYSNSFAPTGSVSTGGIFGNEPSPVMEERNGYFAPITGKKVYYDGTMHFGDEGVPTGAAADISEAPQQAPLQGSVEMNDYSNLFRQLLEGTLPELKDLNPTVGNQNQYYNITYQTFPTHNDEAIIDEWAVPNLVMGTMGIYQAGKTAFELAPYAKDIWAGRNLLFHKPFKWMSKQEYDNYGQMGKNYFQNYLQKNPINIKEYGKINFSSNNRGKDYPFKMDQYPFLRKNLENAKWKFNSNEKNELDRTYDHFYNQHNRKLYDYLIENITDNQGKIIRNYKMMKEILKNNKPKR